MAFSRIKRLSAAIFSAFLTIFSINVFSQEIDPNAHIKTEDEERMEKETNRSFDANEVIFGHILDAHQFHFFSIKGKDGKEHHVTIPLPVILYSPQKGFTVFSAAKFHHGEHAYKGYQLVTQEYKEGLKRKGIKNEELKKIPNETIIGIDENRMPAKDITVYDLSLTRNVVQMIIALSLLVWIMLSIAKLYKKGFGATTAPRGVQNLIEPVIIFIRDEVAKPALGHKYQKYFPYLLTVFFFILINNLVGLIPGTANVTGNIAFTMVLAVISFIIILFSSNRHYWSHIFNPPVPLGVKPILIPVEILGIFTKPFALMIRLFANMLAGHIIIICLVSLIFIFGALNKIIGWGFSPLSIAFVVFIYFIELLVAFLQAYIFTNLTAVFIGQAFEGSHDDVDHHPDPAIV
ncbi:MAG: F0F1 ATP synthase subunit A [Chitinophagaceae bacterium]|nr:F0F1 ATP synthase subunit A [Chitinophagaceae bacterium]